MTLPISTKLVAIGTLAVTAALSAALPSAAATGSRSGAALDSNSPVTADALVEIDAHSYAGRRGTQDSRAFTCPPDAPWLANVSSGFGLRGSTIRGGYQPGDVMFRPAVLWNPAGMAIGWQATPDGVEVSTVRDANFTVVAICTDNPAEGYRL